MFLALALLTLIAGLLLMVIGGTLVVHMPAPRRWMVASFVALDGGLLAGSLLALPFALPLGLG
ncbi:MULTISPECIES: hypothetical protein [Ancylobacter]|uniref:Xanthosine utilization system XapX-like protein n=2 Tax=Ancylobacter TaxID=99 RepID=A0A839ZAJ6_9HYPH|nr:MULTISPECIES: hypothetical protein [Ancylobacter]MBB3771718.1 xanthosine utilization system XapX-like protein [Ancylobacter tetraedralis]MDQ0512214.1 xanthosine utilization system XapX-like protein [Ancylobacter amanitiformis]